MTARQHSVPDYQAVRQKQPPPPQPCRGTGYGSLEPGAQGQGYPEVPVRCHSLKSQCRDLDPKEDTLGLEVRSKKAQELKFSRWGPPE